MNGPIVSIAEAAAAGSLRGVEAVYLFGYNGTTSGSLETVWDESIFYTFLTANMSSPTISSASANDAAAGTGARTVRVTGVDANYAEQTEVVSMNGTSGVALTNSYMSINSIEVVTVGSTGANQGIIYVGTGVVTAGKPATVHGILNIYANSSTSFIYTVPADKRLVITDLYGGSQNTTAGGHEFVIRAATNGAPYRTAFTSSWLNTGSAMSIPNLKTPLVFAAKTQIQGATRSSAGTGPVTFAAHGYLCDSDNVYI